MKLNIISAVGFLTNLRWDWLKHYFFPNFTGRGVRSKVILMTRGGGGVRQKVIFDEGGGVQTPPKKDDIIYEQTLNKAQIQYLYYS